MKVKQINSSELLELSEVFDDELEIIELDDELLEKHSSQSAKGPSQSYRPLVKVIIPSHCIKPSPLDEELLEDEFSFITKSKLNISIISQQGYLVTLLILALDFITSPMFAENGTSSTHIYAHKSKPQFLAR